MENLRIKILAFLYLNHHNSPASFGDIKPFLKGLSAIQIRETINSMASDHELIKTDSKTNIWSIGMTPRSLSLDPPKITVENCIANAYILPKGEEYYRTKIITDSSIELTEKTKSIYAFQKATTVLTIVVAIIALAIAYKQLTIDANEKTSIDNIQSQIPKMQLQIQEVMMSLDSMRDPQNEDTSKAKNASDSTKHTKVSSMKK